jgi:multisubunit Na+/H+ antiporter MnhB subunit
MSFIDCLISLIWLCLLLVTTVTLVLGMLALIVTGFSCKNKWQAMIQIVIAIVIFLLMGSISAYFGSNGYDITHFKEVIRWYHHVHSV